MPFVIFGLSSFSSDAQMNVMDTSIPNVENNMQICERNKSAFTLNTVSLIAFTSISF